MLNSLKNHYNNFNATTELSDTTLVNKVSPYVRKFKRNKSVLKNSTTDKWRNLLQKDLD